MNLIQIVVDDSMVIVNGKAQTVDCSTLIGIHMIIWSNNSLGEIEYSLINGVKKPPTTFTDFSPYQQFVDAWTVANNAPPPPTPPPSSATLVTQSYRASLKRQADALQAQGDIYGAVKMLLKSSGL